MIYFHYCNNNILNVNCQQELVFTCGILAGMRIKFPFNHFHPLEMTVAAYSYCRDELLVI